MGDNKGFGNIDTKGRGSPLVEECGDGHENQPDGKSIGAGTGRKGGGAEHHAGHGMGGEPHSFKPPASSDAHGFGHTSNMRNGPLRMSGHSGAHRIGSKKK